MLRIAQLPFVLRLELFPLVLTVLVPFLEILQFLGLSLDVVAETSVFLMLLNFIVVVEDLAKVVKGLRRMLFKFLLPKD